MRERLITLVCALGSLLLFAALFVRGEGLDSRRVALPTTIERHGNGLAGAKSWLERKASAASRCASASILWRSGGICPVPATF